MKHLLLIVLLAAGLSGCGFHLRGSGQVLPPDLHVMVVDSTAPTAGSWLGGAPGELSRVLKDALANAGITEAADGLRIELLDERWTRRVASVGASASAAEYQLDYLMTFRVAGTDGAMLVDKTALRAERSYRYKPDAIMGSAEEEALLQSDMRRDIAQQILQRLHKATQRTATGAPSASPLPGQHAPAP